MMVKKIALVTLLVSSLFALEEGETEFKTHTELGYISTSGNTKTQNFNLVSKLEKGWNRHSINFIFDGQYASDQDEATKNKFYTDLNYNYSFGERLSFDYLVGYKRDKFSNYDYQFYTGPGAKYHLLKTENHNLTVDGNILYSIDQYMDETLPSEDYASFRAKGLYEWQVFENLKFSEEASYRVDLEDFDNYFVFSNTQLTSKLSDMFSGGLGYKVDYVNLPGDKKHTDTTFTLNLIIDY